MAKIKVSPFSRPEGVGDVLQATQNWNDNVFLQAGHKGLVFVRGTNKSYETCFVEAFPENGGFFRGEGATVEEAELNAWNKYYASQKCVEHEWETRGYKNGAGFCKHCNMFESGVFDVKIVGEPCGTCGVGTFYAHLYSDDENGSYYCEQHCAEAKEELFAKLSHKNSQGKVLSVKENMMYQRLFFELDDTDD